MPVRPLHRLKNENGHSYPRAVLLVTRLPKATTVDFYNKHFLAFLSSFTTYVEIPEQERNHTT